MNIAYRSLVVTFFIILSPLSITTGKKGKKDEKMQFSHVNNKGKFRMWVVIKAGLRTAYRNTKSVEIFFMTRI